MDINDVDPLVSRHKFGKFGGNFKKSEEIMRTMVQTGALSASGYAWLKVALDPWHDTQITGFKGVPDVHTGNSVVMSTVQEVAIARPAGYVNSTWGVKFSSYPIAGSTYMDLCDIQGNHVALKTNPSPGSMYPVLVEYVDGAGDFPEFGTSPVGATGLSIPSDFTKGPFKVAGIGMEVCNTTAELNKQGLCSAAVMNQPSHSATAYQIASIPPATLTTATSLFPVRTTPRNLAEMALLPNLTQWHAGEGSYSVLQLLDVDSTPVTTTPSMPLWFATDEYRVGAVQSFLNYRVGKHVAGVHPNSFVPSAIVGSVPSNSTTVMYTGLSNETTLTLRTRWVLERFPNDVEPEIIVLAKPTAPFDPVALEIYSRVLRKLPPAVMFKENNSREWWKSVLNTVADIVQSGLMMIPHPLAKGAGAALTMARPLIGPVSEKLGEKKKKKNQDLKGSVVRVQQSQPKPKQITGKNPNAAFKGKQKRLA